MKNRFKNCSSWYVITLLRGMCKSKRDRFVTLWALEKVPRNWFSFFLTELMNQEQYSSLENVTLMPYVERLMEILQEGYTCGTVNKSELSCVLSQLATNMQHLADFASPRRTPGAEYTSIEEQQRLEGELVRKHRDLLSDLSRYKTVLEDILQCACDAQQ